MANAKPSQRFVAPKVEAPSAEELAKTADAELQDGFVVVKELANGRKITRYTKSLPQGN